MSAISKDSARARLNGALAQVAHGDRIALKLVYDLTAAKLFGICLRISRNRQAAEDILQDVYIKVWNRAGRFDAARASPITWLCAIARNAAIDWQRANSGPALLPEESAAGIVDDRPGALEIAEAAEERARIHNCLEALDAQKGRVIRAAFFDGLSYPQLAERTAMPLGTIKSWVRRGLAQLKLCLEND